MTAGIAEQSGSKRKERLLRTRFFFYRSDKFRVFKHRFGKKEKEKGM